MILALAFALALIILATVIAARVLPVALRVGIIVVATLLALTAVTAPAQARDTTWGCPTCVVSHR